MHRFGARAGAALNGRPLALVALVVLVLGPTPQARAAEARVEARSGIDIFALHASPGAPVAPGWRLQLASARRYVGSGLEESALRLRWVTGPLATAVAWEQQRSPVHRANALGVVLQVQWRSWHTGLAARMRHLGFDGYASRWSTQLEAGAGVRRPWGALVARARAPHAAANAARIDLGARISLHRHAALFVQHIREAGLPSRLRAALGLSTRAVATHVGYDVATRSVATGLELGSGRPRLLVAVRTHPELGWTHTWMFEFESRKPVAASRSAPSSS